MSATERAAVKAIKVARRSNKQLFRRKASSGPFQLTAQELQLVTDVHEARADVYIFWAHVFNNAVSSQRKEQAATALGCFMAGDAKAPECMSDVYGFTQVPDRAGKVRRVEDAHGGQVQVMLEVGNTLCWLPVTLFNV